MKDRYLDLIEQSFDFPQEEFKLNDKDQLEFHGIDLMGLAKEYGTPLKFSYLPKIRENIQRCGNWFHNAFREEGYEGKYFYCYCTKSSHFRFVIEKAIESGAHIETSSEFDINIVNKLKAGGKLTDDHYIICNGFKTRRYLHAIAELINSGHDKCYPVIDNVHEIDDLLERIDGGFNMGIRIASEEDPKFEFYTSRLGIGYKYIVPFYEETIKPSRAKLRMLHFFINTGITDSAYYWNELHKCLNLYVKLRKVCPTLDSLNIGGGFPIKRSLGFDFDYEYMIKEIVHQVKTVCDSNGVLVPNLYTEFGSFTVGESAGVIFEILGQKKQNDRERWNMINGSFMTTLPDSWALNSRFILLPINRWKEKYERVLLGGLTCDSDDYYNSEQHINAIYLPQLSKKDPLYIGFFNTGAYQESLSGFGGIKHCLIPSPQHVVIDEENGELSSRVFREQQAVDNMLTTLGYYDDNKS